MLKKYIVYSKILLFYSSLVKINICMFSNILKVLKMKIYISDHNNIFKVVRGRKNKLDRLYTTY